MENINWRKEIAFAGVVAIVPLMVAAIMRRNGAGKWLTATATGAIGGLAAAAAIA